MKKETQLKILNEMKNYNADQFELYKAQAGWQDWMNAYTDAADCEEFTAAESNKIETVQKELWSKKMVSELFDNE